MESKVCLVEKDVEQPQQQGSLEFLTSMSCEKIKTLEAVDNTVTQEAVSRACY